MFTSLVVLIVIYFLKSALTTIVIITNGLVVSFEFGYWN